MVKTRVLKTPKNDHEAMKLRSVVMQSLSQAAGLVESIKTCVEWDWANNNQNLGVIEKVVKELRAVFTPFHREFITQDPLVLRKHTSPDKLRTELKSFLAAEAQFSNVSMTCEEIVARHQSKLSVQLPKGAKKARR